MNYQAPAQPPVALQSDLRAVRTGRVTAPIRLQGPAPGQPREVLGSWAGSSCTVPCDPDSRVPRLHFGKHFLAVLVCR